MKILLLLIFPVLLFSQTIKINPYLQNVSPTSITIMWETNTSAASSVDWDTTMALSHNTIASSITSSGSNRIHTATITGLLANTKYYYRVNSGSTSSILYSFYTPANASDEQSINIVAMSDMQRDVSHPNVFNEITHEGIIDYVYSKYGGELNQHLNMILIPGDLVPTGNSYNQWKNYFFDKADPLFSYVPVYPVPGNHENDSDYFFKYFNLPLNGTVGFEEHWWYKDISNVRIIGLESNSAYRVVEQLDWLTNLLIQTANDTTIDFVFAQLHHPYHSELWISGNTNYTGNMITILEDFSTSSGKPSIHFFGHTHGYSRGQSKDHTHLMVNVATAGGNIDSWGEYAQTDYEEYTVSQDEYGYVFLEVEAGAEPKFLLKRISIGDETVTKVNSVEDSILIKRYNLNPNQAVGLFPSENDTVKNNCIVFLGDTFVDPDNDEHGATQWQISDDCSDFSSPIFDKWQQFENWYYEINTQAGDDLRDETVTVLQENTQYCWRLRYRDKSLGWSDWSIPISFYTDTSKLTNNLLLNNGAEDFTNYWIINSGTLESLTAGECSGTTPYAGTYYFGIGGLCNEYAFGSAHQIVDVSIYKAEIDQGTLEVNYGAYMSDYNEADIPAIALQFYDSLNVLLNSTDTTSINNDVWTYVVQNWAIPVDTRYIKYIMMGTRNSGTDNDSYIDETFLKIDLSGVSCSQFILDPEDTIIVPIDTNTNPIDTNSNPIDTNTSISNQTQLLNLKMYPNPVVNKSLLNIPYTKSNHLAIKVYDYKGRIVQEYKHIHPPTFYLEKDDLSTGTYLLQIFDNENIIGRIQFKVK